MLFISTGKTDAGFAQVNLPVAVELLYRSEEATMALLNIALQEGFDDDTVVIRVNEREVFHKSNVSTRLQTGYADSVDVDIPDGSAKVELKLPEKTLSQSIDLQVKDRAYLGVSVTRSGEISYRISQDRFGYL